MKKVISLIIVSLCLVSYQVYACNPKTDPECSCESNSNADADATSLALSNAQASSDSASISGASVNNKTSVSSKNLNANLIETGDVTSRGGSASIIEGDDIITIDGIEATSGDAISSIGDTLANGGSSYTGDNLNNINMNSIYDPGITLPEIPTTYEKIGDVERSTSSLNFFGAGSNANYNRKDSYIIGVSLNIPLGHKTSKEALEFAKTKIEKEKNLIVSQRTVLLAENRRSQEKHNEEMLEMKEKHQAEMAQMCTSLHKFLTIPNSGISPELKSRCASYEHTNNEATNKLLEQIPPRGRHNQEGDLNQVMPHSEEYKQD